MQQGGVLAPRLPVLTICPRRFFGIGMGNGNGPSLWQADYAPAMRLEPCRRYPGRSASIPEGNLRVRRAYLFQDGRASLAQAPGLSDTIPGLGHLAELVEGVG
jgi:hypothetical protein